MLKRICSLVLACLIAATVTCVALAQGDGLQLFLSKTMGFALGQQIQGEFGLAVSGPSDISSVTYLIDGREIGTVTQSPFKYSFNTDNYSPGQHQLTATARTSSGRELTSPAIGVEIITFSAGWQSTFRAIGPLLGVIFLILLVIIGIQVLPIGTARRRYEPGAARNYGIRGGAICSRCHRPFPLSMFSLNLLTGKLERCPYCGKWQLARHTSIEALRAAEHAEIEGATPSIRQVTADERLREQIEQSRISR